MSRADKFLFEKGFFSSRSRAQAAIEEGLVSVNGAVIKKSSLEIADTDDVTVSRGDEYVSRGAYKLLAALDRFGISPRDAVCLDIGASTGGFTQVLLRGGAKKVYALDVGSGQLADVIRSDPRVVSIEHTNCRFMTRDMFAEDIALAVMDVSFISQALIYPAVSDVLQSGGTLLSLIKPQFEAGRGRVGKNGIVRDPDGRIIKDIVSFLSAAADANGMTFVSYIPSPIEGGDGNKEYLAMLKKR